MTAASPATVRRVPTWWTLAVAESRLIGRNRAVLLTAALIPLLMAFLLAQMDGPFAAGSAGLLVAIQLAFLQIFGIFMSVTMTLAARRQQRYLIRLRSSPAGTAAIVAGLGLPIVMITLIQTTIVLVAAAAQTGTTPARPDLLAAAFVIGAVLNGAVGFLTASFTKNPESAQITVLPGMLVLLAGAMIALLLAPGDRELLRLLVPGGAVAELARTGWDGASGGVLELLRLAAVALATAVAAALIAARTFKWHPRT